MTAADRPSPDGWQDPSYSPGLRAMGVAADRGAPVPQTERGTMSEGLPDRSVTGLDAPASPAGTPQVKSERWGIHKASRTYDGGTYDGLSIDAAGTHAGPYATWDEAERVCERLDAVNPVGWVIVPYRPRDGFGRFTCDACGGRTKYLPHHPEGSPEASPVWACAKGHPLVWRWAYPPYASWARDARDAGAPDATSEEVGHDRR